MPYRAYYLDTEGELHRPADGAQIRQALDSWGVLWVDVEDTTEEDADLLIDVFGFQPPRRREVHRRGGRSDARV